MNEELQENEIQNHIKTILNKNFFIYISCFEFIVCYLESLLDLMIKLGRVKLKKKNSSLVPYHIVPYLTVDTHT